MRALLALLLLAAFGMPTGGVVQAQDAVPDTPPELRDFRLDQPQSQPQPTEQPAPQAEPPPAVRTVPDTAAQQPAPTTRTAPTPRRAEPSQQSATPTPAGSEGPLPEPIIEEPAPSDVSASPLVSADNDFSTAPAPTQSGESSGDNVGLFAALAAAIAAIGLLAFLWSRRRQQKMADIVGASEADAIEAPPPAFEKDPIATSPNVAPPAPQPTPAPVPIARQASASVPHDVTITFYPEKATVSFTTLTVQGQLQINNAGKAVVRDMQLRAVLLSASSQQQTAVETFFAKPSQIPKNPLGDAKPGERLGLSLELSVPLNEMQTFPLGKQQLLVPIIVASLSYSDEQGNHAGEARLANMIGREAQPPQPKMGPLRLDKGPRSFAPLGQRPIYT